tara:strand:+ start:527 stop:1018 length:492 start_codon:yes stop_codon:yes gene_type:complete
MTIKLKDGKAYFTEKRTLNMRTLWQSISALSKSKRRDASPAMLIESCASAMWLQKGVERLRKLLLLSYWGDIVKMFFLTSGLVVLFTVAAIAFSLYPVETREATAVIVYTMLFTLVLSKAVACLLWFGQFFIERLKDDLEIRLCQAGIEKVFIIHPNNIYLEV